MILFREATEEASQRTRPLKTPTDRSAVGQLPPPYVLHGRHQPSVDNLVSASEQHMRDGAAGWLSSLQIGG
jgi:hypothetical protein